MKTRVMVSIILCAMFFSLNSMAAETVYPTRAIEIAIGFGPGGGNDLLTRLIAEEAKKYLGQEVVCVNKPGGGGRVVATLISKEKPDGYSLAATSDDALVMAPYFQDIPVAFNALTDLTYISQSGNLSPHAITVPQNSPFKTLKDLIQYARANPDKLVTGTIGVQTTDHIALQLLALRENLKIRYVPFDGSVSLITALLGGNIMMAAPTTSGSAQHVKAKSFRLLAVLEEDRAEEFPDVPTMKELGYPELVFKPWYVIAGPKNMEKSVASKLEDAFKKAMTAPAFINLAKKLMVYTNKPLFGDELRAALAKRDKTFKDLAIELGRGKK
jgi:tripartite-type tricarboxylate transporter receptor subunit TctC